LIASASQLLKNERRIIHLNEIPVLQNSFGGQNLCSIARLGQPFLFHSIWYKSKIIPFLELSLEFFRLNQDLRWKNLTFYSWGGKLSEGTWILNPVGPNGILKKHQYRFYAYVLQNDTIPRIDIMISDGSKVGNSIQLKNLEDQKVPFNSSLAHR